jgi:hypothetical protein
MQTGMIFLIRSYLKNSSFYLFEEPGCFSCHARVGGHPVGPTNDYWIPACGGMTRVE